MESSTLTNTLLRLQMNLSNIEKYEDLIDSSPRAEVSLIELASRNDSDAAYVLGIAYYDGDISPQSSENAIKFLTIASNLGHLKAKHDLACFYYYAYCFPQGFQDFEKAVSLLEENANENYVPSLTFLSSMYKNGEGVEVNELKAQDYLNKAILNGFKPNET